MHLAYLQPADLDALHGATLRILDEVGIRLPAGEAHDMLLDSGASTRDGRLMLPPHLVERCLERCPSQVELQGRGGRITLGAGELHVHNLGGAREILDRPESLPRAATTQDVAASARLLDALDSVTTVTPMFTPQDVAPRAVPLAMLRHTVESTLKPINGPGVQRPEEVRLLAEMLRVVFGQHPAVSLGVSPISPLAFPVDIAAAIVEVARQGLPLGPLPCPNAGATAPMSLAGALAQQNAENLAAIVIAQLVRPGLPVIYCGRLAVLNMRKGIPAWGNPEIGLAAAATVQLGHRYGLPVNVYGLATSTFSLDMQNGYERALNAVVPALAGADELSGVGEMAGGICSCPAQMVIDDEIMGMVGRLRRGLSVDEDSLAVSVIGEVIAGSGNFLAEPHTVQYLRAGEAWQGRLAVQEAGWSSWQQAGRPLAVERARQRAEQLLASHDVPPLAPEQARALDAIIAAE